MGDCREEDTPSHHIAQTETTAWIPSQDEDQGGQDGFESSQRKRTPSPHPINPHLSLKSTGHGPLEKTVGQDFSFGRSKRLKGHKEFQRVFLYGKKITGDGMIWKVLPNGLGRTRFGCVVKNRVIPNAVGRNRMKRWLREIFRLHQNQLPLGLDMVAVVVERPKEMSYRWVKEQFLLLLADIQGSQKG